MKTAELIQTLESDKAMFKKSNLSTPIIAIDIIIQLIEEVYIRDDTGDYYALWKILSDKYADLIYSEIPDDNLTAVYKRVLTRVDEILFKSKDPQLVTILHEFN